MSTFSTIIAFVNSERGLATSRVDITLYISLCYIIKNIKHFTVLIINTVISTLVEIGKFLVFPISTRVHITVYQHAKYFIFVKT